MTFCKSMNAMSCFLGFYLPDTSWSLQIVILFMFCIKISLQPLLLPSRNQIYLAKNHFDLNPFTYVHYFIFLIDLIDTKYLYHFPFFSLRTMDVVHKLSLSNIMEH